MFVSGRSKTIVLLALFLALRLAYPSQTTSSKPEVTPSATAVEPVALTTIVYNGKGNLVTGLQRENFKVFIDNRPTEIVDFREEDGPLSVGIIFDASGSVGYPQLMRPLIKSSQQALSTFLQTSNPANEYFLMASISSRS